MNKKESIWAQMNTKVLIPGVVIMLVFVVAGILAPGTSYQMLHHSVLWIMDHFKWFFIMLVILISLLFAAICFTKWGDIRLGGKDAKPSLKTSTWFTLSLTGTIAVGICFYGVSGPVNMLMNPPEFMGVEAGTKEAIIPVLKYCYLHYAFPPFFIIVAFALMASLMLYNGKRTMRSSDALHPLLGKKSEGPLGTVIDVVTVLSLMVCGTNMGLAVIQLNAGIGTVAGMSWTPSFEPFIILGYTLLTIVLATSGVHKLMGKLSNFNAACYFVILLFILLFGAAGGNRLLGTFFTSLGEFVRDYIPMISFADPIYETGWQTNMTIYYYSWNIVPAFLSGLFYITLAYGRTLREFIVVNCIGPGVVTCLWYVVFGGSAMFSVVNGGDLYDQMQRFGDGIATFAFLESLPGGAILKWLFIILAILTFLTFSDSIAFSFPMLFMKELETDSSKTKVPKFMNVAVALFMGALTFVLLYIGGYDALNEMIVFLGFPLGIVMFLIVLSTVKMLTNREKYDLTYQEELAQEAAEEKQPLHIAEQETQQIIEAK